MTPLPAASHHAFRQMHEIDMRRYQIVAAIEADRAQRPAISHAEAQELHEIIGGLVRGLRNGREYVTDREAGRALEIAALIVSDTEEE